MTVHRPPADSVRTTGNQCLLSHFLASLGDKRKLIAHQCCDQLTAVKTGHPLTSITWPYRGLKCRRLEVEYFWSYPLTNYQFQMIAGSSLFFPMIYICLCHYGPALLGFWFQTDLESENSACFFFFFKYMRGRPFLTMATRWSRSTSIFYALIGQNWTGEFMRKIYAASWMLFTLTAEADRVLCQLVIFLTVFFLWMYKIKYSWYQESSVIHGWFFLLGLLFDIQRIASLAFFRVVQTFYLKQQNCPCLRNWKAKLNCEWRIIAESR